ncbi:MAG: hypothetical protein CMC07_08610 [Flavobacteriaceae bacterium]|jgi:hypothetical protein|nr:hypothetical protein [Flavobacteriaceae bacterium]|tara:strand:+ start:31841 stop:32350 length:510 start_codon:yes stop_codon:yes gene_type:complete
MKKLLLVAALAVFMMGTSFAQGQFKIGANGAIPVGDAGDSYTFGVGVDVAYLFEVADMVWIGPQASYFHYFGDDVEIDTGIGTISGEVEDAAFLPIAASGRIGFGESFYVGADLGYGIGISPDGNDGGFYYRPKAGYSFGTVGIIASYSGVSLDGGNFSSINFGVEFGL